MKIDKHCKLCSKCGLNYAYEDKNLCWVCFLKSKKLYYQAKKAVISGSFLCKTGLCDLALGWSFCWKVDTVITLLDLFKNPVLNQKPQTNDVLLDYFSDWQIAIAKEHPVTSQKETQLEVLHEKKDKLLALKKQKIKQLEKEHNKKAGKLQFWVDKSGFPI